MLASDGLWNLASHEAAVKIIEMTDRKWFREALYEKVRVPISKYSNREMAQ